MSEEYYFMGLINISQPSRMIKSTPGKFTLRALRSLIENKTHAIYLNHRLVLNYQYISVDLYVE